jgi:two-component system, chemotaxis family, sensor kinase CheA
MSASAAVPRALFLQDACIRLQDLRQAASALRHPRAASAELQQARAVALYLQAASNGCGLPLFASIAAKLAGVFDYALLHEVAPEPAAVLAGFVLDAATLLERDLQAAGEEGAEPQADFASFRARHPYAFAPAAHDAPPPPAPGSLPSDSPVADAELLEMFVTDAEEQLETVTECLLALESEPAGEHVHRLFRAMHTLKGSSAQVGLRRMAQVAHSTEELLAGLRQGRLPCTTELIYVCLEAVDTLRKFLYRQWSDEAVMQERVSALLQRIAALAEAPVAPPAVHPAAETSAEPAQPSVAPPSDLQPRLVRVLSDRLDRMSATAARLGHTRTQVLGRLADMERVAQQLGSAARAGAASSIASGMEQLTSILGSVDSDLEDLARLTDNLEREIRRATMVPIGGLYIRIARTVREAGAAEGKRIQLSLHGADTELDSRLLHQLSDPLVHLVRNAIAHGIEGDQERYASGKSAHAQLIVRAYRRPNLVCVEVEDDGHGLDFERIRSVAVEAQMVAPGDVVRLQETDLLRLLFEPGFSTRAFSNQVAGRGVGLDAVAAAMAALNAEIEVRSRPGAGTCFTLKIPLQPLTVQASRPLPPLGSGAATAPLVLVVDSNILFFRQLSESLRGQGLEAARCCSASDAVAMLEWNAPALILCATGLPEMGAFDLARLLRAEPRTAAIPVVALGGGEGAALMEAYRAGCSELLDRGLGPQRLAGRLAEFLRARREGFQPTQMVSSAESSLSGDLSRMDLPAFMQMLLHSRQTGMLHVNAAVVDGVLLFQNGELCHAECGDLVGDEAVLRIVGACGSAVSGVCKFVPGPVGHTRTVLRNATELMLDALRRQDEDERDAAMAPEGLS